MLLVGNVQFLGLFEVTILKIEAMHLNPKKTAKPKKSLLEIAMSLPKANIFPEDVFLEPHERLSPEERRHNIEEARKKGLIKAKVIL